MGLVIRTCFMRCKAAILVTRRQRIHRFRLQTARKSSRIEVSAHSEQETQGNEAFLRLHLLRGVVQHGPEVDLVSVELDVGPHHLQTLHFEALGATFSSRDSSKHRLLVPFNGCFRPVKHPNLAHQVDHVHRRVLFVLDGHALLHRATLAVRLTLSRAVLCT